MSESATIEIWEIQKLRQQKTWIPDEKKPWAYKSLEECLPPDEITLPSSEWIWATNWRIDCKSGLTDPEGWEFAGKLSSFAVPNRKPKIEKAWNSKVRRRMWSRVMRREAGIPTKLSDLSKALPRIQSGLSSIHQARNQIEAIADKAPEALLSDEIKPLIDTVKKNISDIIGVLEQFELQINSNSTGGTQAAVVNKLKNDVLKEQSALEKLLNPNFIDIKSKSQPKTRQSFTVKNGLPPRLSESFSSRSTELFPRKSLSMSEQTQSMSKNPFESDENETMRGSSPIPQIATPSHSFSFKSDSPLISKKQDSVTINGSTPAKPKVVVKGGSAKSFDPTILTSDKKSNPLNAGLNDNWETPRDGVFVDRTTQQRMIEQKLRPVDEATVMQLIIDERAEEIQKIHKGIVQVQDMFLDLSRIVKEQQVEIDKIFENVEASHVKTQDAFKNIVQAEKLQRQSNCIIS